MPFRAGFLASLFTKTCLKHPEACSGNFLWQNSNWLKSYAGLKFSATFTSPPCSIESGTNFLDGVDIAVLKRHDNSAIYTGKFGQKIWSENFHASIKSS